MSITLQGSEGCHVTQALYTTASKKTPASKSKPKCNTFNSTPTRSLIRAITEMQAEPDLNLTGSGLTCTPALNIVLAYTDTGSYREHPAKTHISIETSCPDNGLNTNDAPFGKVMSKPIVKSI